MLHKSLVDSFLFTLLLLFGLFSCGDRLSTTFVDPKYQIVTLDSVQVEFHNDIHVAAFHNRKGIFYNFREGSFTVFDTSGSILIKKSFPSEGSDGLGYVSGMKMKPDGNILLQTLQGEIVILDDSLELVDKVVFPFASGTPNLRSNIKSLDIIGNEAYIYYPGRHGQNPLEKGFFRNSKLLEKVNLTTGELTSVLSLSPDSKFNQDLYFEDPYLHVSIWGDRLYFAFDNEPVIYEYDLNNTNALPITIPLLPTKFLEVSGLPIPLGNVDGIYPGLIEAIFPFDRGFAVAYTEGLEKASVDKLTNLNPKYVKSLQRNLLKIYDHEKGWSGEIPISRNVAAILGFDNPLEVFYALRNEELFNNEPGKITLYRLALREIE
jgi:hypothetical protein